MSFSVLAFAMEKALESYANRKQAAEIASQVAQQLRENNATLIDEMQRIVEAAFSANKLAECENRIDSLSVFLDEYKHTPEDKEKLHEVDIHSQFVLDTLDDPDVRVAGLPSFATAACLRVTVLKMKSFTFPGDLVNAKKRARVFARHIDGTLPFVYDLVKAQFSELKMKPAVLVAGGVAVPEQQWWIISKPGQPGVKRQLLRKQEESLFDLRERGIAARQTEIDADFAAVKAQQLSDVITCSKALAEFGNS